MVDFYFHKVVWTVNDIFEEITRKYVNYVTTSDTRVFDGYSDIAHLKGTKNAERLKQRICVLTLRLFQ